MKYGTPVESDQGKHKFKVLVWDEKRGKDKIVHFGHRDYEDFTQHHDLQRKKNYLTRSAGITDGSGNLTKDDPLSANYWSRRYLWNSRERKLNVSPPASFSPKRVKSPTPTQRSKTALSPKRAAVREPRKKVHDEK